MIQRLITFFVLTVQAVLLVYELLARYDTFGRQNALALTNFVVVAVFVVVQRLFRRRYGITIHWIVLVTIALSVWLDAVGNFQHWYARFWWWDRVTHVAGGLALTVGIYVVCFALWRAQRLKVSWRVFNLYAFSAAQSIGALYEVSEWVGDELFQTGRIQGLFDTPRDLFFNMLGGLLVIMVGRWWRFRQRAVRGDG